MKSPYKTIRIAAACIAATLGLAACEGLRIDCSVHWPGWDFSATLKQAPKSEAPSKASSKPTANLGRD
jgi:hypothetical protein